MHGTIPSLPHTSSWYGAYLSYNCISMQAIYLKYVARFSSLEVLHVLHFTVSVVRFWEWIAVSAFQNNPTAQNSALQYNPTAQSSALQYNPTAQSSALQNNPTAQVSALQYNPTAQSSALQYNPTNCTPFSLAVFVRRQGKDVMERAGTAGSNSEYQLLRFVALVN